MHRTYRKCALNKIPEPTRWTTLLNSVRSKSSSVVQSDHPELALIRDDVKSFSDIPGPKHHWSVRVASLLFSKDGVAKGIHRLQEDTVRKYGPLIRTSGLEGPEVWIADPKDAATVIRAEAKYPQRVSLRALDIYLEKKKKAPGVFFAAGPRWYKLRSALSQRMLSPPQAGQYIPRLNSIIDDFMTRLEENINTKDGEEKHEVSKLNDLMFHWSFECVADVLFDKRFGALSSSITEEIFDFIGAVETFLLHFMPVFLLPPFVHQIYKSKSYKAFDAAYMKMYSYAHLFTYKKMEDLERREQCEMSTGVTERTFELIPYLLTSNKVKPEEVEDCIVDTLFAGIDTTSKTAQWILYLLAKNLKQQEILRDEIDLHVPKGSVPDLATLQKMVYLSGVIKETLRLYPVLISLNRVLTSDVILSGYHVPAGTPAVILSHAMSRRPEVFEDPLDFKPERWLRSQNGLEVNSFGSTPFGHGRRMCLGRRLAELELKLLLIRIFQYYTLEYPAGEVVECFLRGTNIQDRPVRARFLKRV